MADEIIEALRKNDPECTEVVIVLRHFRNANTLLWLVQALKMNRHVTKLCFWFDDDESKLLVNDPSEDENDDKPLLMGHWKPLLEAIEIHQLLDSVQIHNSHYNGLSLMPLYCELLFPVIEKNGNVKTLCLDHVDFSNHAVGLVKHLEASVNLLELVLVKCCERNGAGDAANALQRNSHLQSLRLEMCFENLVCPVLYGLASPGSASKLKTLVYRPEQCAEGPLAQEAMRMYLASPSATIECFELRDCDMELATILKGMARNSLMENMTFENCRVDEESAHLLVSCVLTKPNLSTLRLFNCNFGMFPPFLDAMVEILTRDDSSLRHFEVVCDMAAFVSRRGFETLLVAIAESTGLEHLEIGTFDDTTDDAFDVCDDDELPYLQCLLQVMPMLKLTTLQVIYASPAKAIPRTVSAQQVPDKEISYPTACAAQSKYFL